MTVSVRLRSVVWFVVGMVAAVGVAWWFNAGRAGALPGVSESTFVPVTPCRLLDTRGSESQVGPRGTPLDGGVPYAVQVSGTNGQCVLPAGIAGVALNVTVVSPSAAGWLALYPGGTVFPGTSNLNFVAGQAPTPNKVDVKVSADGKVNLLNNAGTVHVVGDVVGYYASSGMADLVAKVTALETKIAALESKTASMSTVTVDSQPTVRFSGVNVQIVSGAGSTVAAVNGRGNLIVGYNESTGDTRTGSHNLVVGTGHSYLSYGGFLAGANNTILGTAAFASVSGGVNNTASGISASVSGGDSNTASGDYASVSGGAGNLAGELSTSVSGGNNNSATEAFSSVSGGVGNAVIGFASSVSGGLNRIVLSNYAYP